VVAATLRRHARACQSKSDLSDLVSPFLTLRNSGKPELRWHPRLAAVPRHKTWMAGTSPAMTLIGHHRAGA
jgi:hypothetical protein